MKRIGATLMEVVVVIAIILVLASLLFPVIGQSRFRALDTVCISNLRQISSAMILYKEDSGDFPPVTATSALFNFSPGIEKMHCYAQKDKRLIFDYTLWGPRPETLPGSLQRTHDYEACRTKRGSMFPIVTDKNHSSIVEGYSTGSRFFLIAREAGNVDRVPASHLVDMLGGKESPPCAITLGAANL